MDKINSNYVPVSELNEDEKISRRVKERAKKKRQRKCKKHVAMDVEHDESKNEPDLSKDETNEISDYEKLRQENIQERTQKMKALGLKTNFN